MHFLNPILLVAYVVVTLYTVVRILLDTDATPKALGYLLLVLAFPVVGIVIYFSFGMNFRHLSSRYKAAGAQAALDKCMRIHGYPSAESLARRGPPEVEQFNGLIEFLKGLDDEPLHEGAFTLLTNGEAKFPEVLRTLETARKFIHMEYYAWENDVRGNQIKDVLLRKAKEGIKIRIIYDAYASRKISGNIAKELRAAGISVVARIKLKLTFLANRFNHRDHRKIIIVDGITGFVGGINVSDRYDNSIDTGLYWRDTHLKIEGSLVNSLQRHFVVSWNSSQGEKLSYTEELFPGSVASPSSGVRAAGQVVAGGPIYPTSNIMLTYLKVFTSANRKLYITNPYFVPNDTILDSLTQAAISGVDVRLLLPYESDSAIVGAASKFYFPALVRAGVKIHLYKKGFVHAKTVVADSSLSVIGTANMDIRSFDLNFEIMALIYSKPFAEQFEKVFLDDLKECVEVTREMVDKASLSRRLFYSVARLISAFL